MHDNPPQHASRPAPGYGVGGAATGVRVGDTLLGKYRVERMLGAGGMGQVFLATHLGLEQQVAIKCLLPNARHSPTSLARFEREARVSVKIRSEHVARTLDVGKLPDQTPFIVMEYLHGADLAELLDSHGPFPLERAVSLVLQASEALAEAHAMGVVHRDLKLANLFLTLRADGSDCLKVLDFGISKLEDAGLSLTSTSAMIGSPRTMSPEQLTNPKGVDARADIWALGVVLYMLVSGRVPFDAEVLPELVIKITSDAPAALAAEVPEGFRAIVERCLMKRPSDRFQSVGELGRALAKFGDEAAAASATRISRVLAEAALSIAHEPMGVGADTQQTFSATTPVHSRVSSASFGHDNDRVTLKDVAGLTPTSSAHLIALGLGVSAVAGAVWFFVTSAGVTPHTLHAASTGSALPLDASPKNRSTAPAGVAPGAGVPLASNSSPTNTPGGAAIDRAGAPENPAASAKGQALLGDRAHTATPELAARPRKPERANDPRAAHKTARTLAAPGAGAPVSEPQASEEELYRDRR